MWKNEKKLLKENPSKYKDLEIKELKKKIQEQELELYDMHKDNWDMICKGDSD